MNTKIITSLGLGALMISSSCRQEAKKVQQPNILFAISDDQTWVHTSFAGCEAVKTPAFDWVARNGVYFENAFCSAPILFCIPCRHPFRQKWFRARTRR